MLQVFVLLWAFGAICIIQFVLRLCKFVTKNCPFWRKRKPLFVCVLRSYYGYTAYYYDLCLVHMEKILLKMHTGCKMNIGVCHALHTDEFVVYENFAKRKSSGCYVWLISLWNQGQRRCSGDD